MLYEKSKAKNIISDKKYLNEVVLKTIKDMATIVAATLGPGGRGVLIERDGLSPLMTKDGVTVAKSLGLAEADANIIVEACKEICINTAKDAGDGTTTAIVLASMITQYGQDFVSKNPKYNPQRIASELQDVYNKIIIPYLKEHSVKADNEKMLKHVATISANGDEEIAEHVVKAVMAAGEDGKVLIEEAQGEQIKVETIDGYIVTSGLKELGHMGPVFINDKANQQVKMDNGLVFLYDGTINDLKVPSIIQDMLEATELLGAPVLVFAHDFADIVIDKFVKATKGGITIVPVKTPRSGLPNGRSMFLYDMSAYTGATVYDPATIQRLMITDDDSQEQIFGEFEEAKVNMYETFLISCADADSVDARIGELKSIMQQAFSELDRMHIRTAISKLTGGVSTIWVGSTSLLRTREKMSRVEDAVEAVRSAILEGVVPGGCTVLLLLADMIEKSKQYKPSWEIMVKALRDPFKLLLTNCGEDPDDIISIEKRIRKVNTKGLPKNVFDSNSHTIVDPFTAGIIEPAKVIRIAVGNALSVAVLLITIGGIVVVPRDANLEQQLAMADKAFKDMMSAGDFGGG